MIQIKVYSGHIKRYTATLQDWDLGMVFGDGDTVQEAIENFLEMWECKFNERPNYIWI